MNDLRRIFSVLVVGSVALSAAAQSDQPTRPRAAGDRKASAASKGEYKTFQHAAAQRQSRVRWVRTRGGQAERAALQEQYARSQQADVRPGQNIVTYYGYFGVGGRYEIPEYEGPPMDAGYGRGYDALAYRYGLEEALHRYEYNPYYWNRGGGGGFGGRVDRGHGHGRTGFGDTNGAAHAGVEHGSTGQDITRRRLNLHDMTRRAERVLARQEQKVYEGLDLLKRDESARAVVALTLAAKLNQSDPTARIHLAQAKLVRGHYHDAGLAIRRALQLQPKLIYEDLNLDRYFARRGTLDRETEKLAKWVADREPNADVLFLLGFLQFQRGDFPAAYDAFRKSADSGRADDATRAFLDITKPADGR